MATVANLELTGVLDALGAGLLIFDPKDKLVYDNAAARNILSQNLVIIRSEGWSAIAMLIDAVQRSEQQVSAADLRNKARSQIGEPVRFQILLSGSYTPCWISSVTGTDSKQYTAILIERPDWSALTELMSTFRAEARNAITSTSGHAEFVRKLLKTPPKNTTLETLGQKSMGMINVISSQMYSLQMLMDLLHRLEVIRTGQLNEQIEQRRKKVHVSDFIEDLVEELSEDPLLDPFETKEDYRARLVLDVDDNLHVNVPKAYLRNIMRDVMRNALMYSEPGSPVTIRAKSATQGRHVEFSIKDEGYGIPPKETDRVFRPFERARQPQVMRESGYGLSLYLTKAEIEAMGGRIWFESELGIGTTFSFKLPVSG